MLVRTPSTTGSINAQDFANGLRDELCCRAVFSLANGLSLLVRVQHCQVLANLAVDLAMCSPAWLSQVHLEA